MNNEVPLLKGLVVGSYGQTCSVTLKDFDGTAQDVSAYTGTNYVVFRSPDSRKTIVCTASFYTDGSDAIITWSFSSGDPLDRQGLWSAQVELNCSSALAKSYPFNCEVEKELR